VGTLEKTGFADLCFNQRLPRETEFPHFRTGAPHKANKYNETLKQEQFTALRCTLQRLPILLQISKALEIASNTPMSLTEQPSVASGQTRGIKSPVCPLLLMPPVSVTQPITDCPGILP